MSYHLFLDDERLPSHVTWVALPIVVWQVVRNYDQFVDTITNHGVPKFVTFDHDLADEHYRVMAQECQHAEKRFTIWMPGDDEHEGLNMTFDYGEEKTGYDCAKWLVDYCIDNGHRFPEFQVHSMNPIGKQRIIAYIENAKKHTGI